MIVLEDRKIVIITPPHTASGNISKVLCTPEFGGQWVIGYNQVNNSIDHHNVQIHPSWIDFTRVLIVREPLSRLVGLWMHYSYAISKPNFVGRTDLTFPSFIMAVAEDHPGYLSWFFRWTITRLIEPVNYLSRIIKYESLEEGLEKLLGQKVTLPPQYHAPIVVDEWFRNKRLKELAVAWGQPDTLRFNYETYQ